MKNTKEVQRAIQEVLDEMKQLTKEDFIQEFISSMDGGFARLLKESGCFESCDYLEPSLNIYLQDSTNWHKITNDIIVTTIIEKYTSALHKVDLYSELAHKKEDEVTFEEFPLWMIEAA